MYKLIIIDDEESIREGLKNYIDWNQMEFEVEEVFSDAEEAVDFLDEKSTEIDVILTDIRMENMQGTELAEYVAKKYPHIKVVFLSAYSDFEYAKTAIIWNVVDYLLKPVQLADIRTSFERIRGMLKEAHTSKDVTKELITDKTKSSTQIINKAKQYIEEHFQDEECTLEHVAGYVNLAPTYFSKVFKEECGQRFSDYIITKRIDKAIFYLENTSMKIYEISEKVGYTSQRYFAKLFKREVGCLPKQYKNSRVEDLDE